jgi:outer membrane protein TolC
VQTSVVAAHQASILANKAVPIARQQVKSAKEALRLTQQIILAGTGLLIDALQAQDAADQARLRYATAIVQYNQAQINLLGAMGLIKAKNLTGPSCRAPATPPVGARRQNRSGGC